MTPPVKRSQERFNNCEERVADEWQISRLRLRRTLSVITLHIHFCSTNSYDQHTRISTLSNRITHGHHSTRQHQKSRRISSASRRNTQRIDLLSFDMKSPNAAGMTRPRSGMSQSEILQLARQFETSPMCSSVRGAI